VIVSANAIEARYEQETFRLTENFANPAALALLKNRLERWGKQSPALSVSCRTGASVQTVQGVLDAAACYRDVEVKMEQANEQVFNFWPSFCR
jgi:hypothetical protein